VIHLEIDSRASGGARHTLGALSMSSIRRRSVRSVAKLNGRLVDFQHPIHESGRLERVPEESAEGLSVLPTRPHTSWPRGRQALPGSKARDRAGHRRSFSLRLPGRPAVSARRSRADRGVDATRSPRRTINSSAASWLGMRRSAGFGMSVQGRADRRHPGSQGEHLHPLVLHGLLPGAARPRTKMLRHFKLLKRRGRLLAGRFQPPQAPGIYGTRSDKDRLKEHLERLEQAKLRTTENRRGVGSLQVQEEPAGD